MPALRLRLLAAWGQSRRLLGTSVGLSHPLRGTPVGLSHPLRGTSVAARGARCLPRADRVPANLAGTRARTYSALPTGKGAFFVAVICLDKPHWGVGAAPGNSQGVVYYKLEDPYCPKFLKLLIWPTSFRGGPPF